MKHRNHRLISATESAILASAFIALVLALVFSLFLAQRYLIATAQYWDSLRVERYMRLCQMALEGEARAWPSEESLQKLRDIGLFIDVYPPDHEIPQPNPRYIPSLGSFEAWGYIRDSKGKPTAVIRTSRHDINTRHTIKTVRLYTLLAAIGGTVLIGAIGLALRRTVIRRIGKVVRQIEAHLPPRDGIGIAAEDPLERLEQATREMLGAREEAKARTQKLLDGHSELACLESTDGTLLEVNAAYCRLFGKTREQMVGTNYLDLIPPADRTDALDGLRKLSRRNPSNVVEHRVLLPDGRVRWTRWTDTAVFENGDTVTGVLSFGQDITEEKNLAGRIAALQSAFGQMQTLARTGSLTWSFTEDRMEWTDETWRLLGIAKDSCQPSLDNLLAVVSANDRVTLRELFRKARENGEAFDCEFRCLLADGSPRILQSRAEVRADRQTKLLDQLTCTLRDISDLRDAEAATKRELRFREAVEQSLASGIVASDEQGRVLSVNPAFCKMTGWSAEELCGAIPPYPYWPEEEMAAIRRAFDTTLGGHTPPQGYELRFKRKDGSRFDVLVRVAPLLDAEDRRLGWLASVTDITSIQEIRRNLLEAEATARQELSYRQTIEKATTVGLIAINQEGRPISVNGAYCTMFGYTEEEIMAMRPPYPLWPEKERENIEKAFAQHLAGQSPPGGFSLRFKRKDGSLVDLLITVSALHDAHGQPIGVLSALTDITPLQEAQRSLRAANERLQIAQSVAEFGIWDWDPAQDTLFWDRQSFALFGHPDASDAEAVWAAVLPEHERERLTYELRRLIKSGGTSGQDLLRVRWPDGEVHEISSTYLVMRDDRGEAVRVFGVNRDVTRETIHPSPGCRGGP